MEVCPPTMSEEGVVIYRGDVTTACESLIRVRRGVGVCPADEVRVIVIDELRLPVLRVEIGL